VTGPPLLPHDDLACGASDNSSCEQCKRRWQAEEEARWPHYGRPGPRPDALVEELRQRVEGRLDELVEVMGPVVLGVLRRLHTSGARNGD
jgi:hypothetical protein